ncbi:MAG: hypothetical protein MUE67_08070 [Anaerolineales bacterium]|nr:hypothetical protein [Anaerolineales bacterium]
MPAPITCYHPHTLIERSRLLPGLADVSVRLGQVVSAEDVIAETSYGTRHLLLDVSRGLRLPPDQVDKYLTCHIGLKVAARDVLAGPVGVARRLVRTPVDGRVVLIEAGQILLEVAGHTRRLQAGLPGKVVDLVPERGVVIQNTGALLQGAWGNGKIGQGPLRIHLEGDLPNLQRADLDGRLSGSILVAGYCSDPQVIQAAASFSLKGLVLASLDPALLPLVASSDVPLILLEGFGCYPLSPLAMEILLASSGKLAALNAEPGEPTVGSRPELIIPAPEIPIEQPNSGLAYFAHGKKVRLIPS